jgi:hypothetical protein
MQHVPTMTVPELSKAAHDVAALAVEIAADHREAALALLDLGDTIQEELLARAFGGGAQAREHARKVFRERAAH